MIVKTDTVKTDKFEMDYVRFGEGERTAVILPGLSMKNISGMAQSVASAYKCFADGYTTYLFDRRTLCPEVYTIYDMANDTAEAFDALGIKDAYVFGVSQGGMIAQVAAIERPDLVKKLALASTVARFTGNDKDTILRWTDLAEKRELEELGRDFVNSLYTEDFVKQFGGFISKLLTDVNEDELKRFIILAKGIDGFDVYDKLEKIKAPVLVLGADKDLVFSVNSFVELAEKANAELYIYKAYGHAVFDEAPDFKERVLEFFNLEE